MDPIKSFINVSNTGKFFKTIKRLSGRSGKNIERLTREISKVDQQPHVDFSNIAVEKYSSTLGMSIEETDKLHALGMEQLTECPLFPVMTFMVPIKRSWPGVAETYLRSLVMIDLKNKEITYVWKGVGAADAGIAILPVKYVIDPDTGRFLLDFEKYQDDEILAANINQVRVISEKHSGELIPPKGLTAILLHGLSGIMIDFLDAIIYTLADLHLNDYYPFSVKPVKKGTTSVRDKSSVANHDNEKVRRIIYLNKQIGEYDRDRKPGEKDVLGLKRTGHARRGSWWSMRADRFKGHKNYGLERANYRKATWVGEESSEYKGNVYRILLPQGTHVH